MLNNIKLALRISTDSFDEELRDLINACKSDLKLSGITNIDEDDSLIKGLLSYIVKQTSD